MGKRKRVPAGRDFTPPTVTTPPAAAAAHTATAASPVGFPFRPGFMLRVGSTRAGLASTRSASLPPTAPMSQPVMKKERVSPGGAVMAVSSHSTASTAVGTSQPAAASSAASASKIPASGNQVEEEEAPEFMSTYRSATDPQLAVVCVDANCVLYLSGVCALTVLRGGVNINGYKAKHLQKLSHVFSPSWAPAHRLHFSEAKSGKAQGAGSVQMALKQLGLSRDFGEGIAKDTHDCAILVQGYEVASLEWLLAAEDFSKYECLGVSQYGRAYSNYCSVQTAILCDQPSLADIGIEALTVPKSWVTAAASVCADSKDPRVMISGAKGVGKSTCLKYVINRLLSKLPAVCVIDCDLGQPEFTAPGLLSLHIIRQPVLSTSHLNIKDPELSFYIGDVTPKNEPSLMLSALEKLYCRYNDILIKRMERPKRALAAKGSISSNGFTALNEQYSEQLPPLPLIINTDGFIRYLGAEILTGIARRLRPTHILQLVTSKDKNIEPIDEYVAGSIAAGSECQLHSVEVGRSSASRIAAVDLRSLRLVSYFLRHSKLMKGRYPLSSDGDESISNCEEDISFVYVKTGGLVDPFCATAKALLLTEVTSLPMADCPVSVLAGETVPRALIPAALNASLVGMTRLTSAATVCPHGLSYCSTVPLLSRAGDGPIRFDMKIYESRCMQCGLYDAMLPCDELVVVRAVDTARRMFHVIRPINSQNAVKPAANESRFFAGENGVYCLSKGAVQLPTIMTYVADFPLHTYLSGDSVGEGSGSTRGRANIKRRGAGRV